MIENITIDINKEHEPIQVNYSVVGKRKFKYKVYITEALLRIVNWIGVIKIKSPI